MPKFIIAKSDLFLKNLKTNSPEIILKGELYDCFIPYIQYQSISELDKNVINSNKWEQQKIDHYALKIPLWEKFYLNIINDKYFNNLYKKIYLNKPLELNSLLLAVVQYSQGSITPFVSIYPLIYQQANPHEIDKWVKLAENCNLPYLFQKTIKNPL